MRLLKAGVALAAQHSLDELTPELISDISSLSPEQFARQLGSVDGYMLELNQQYLDYILDRLVRETGSHPPSLWRMCRATELQLDICLEHRDLQNLLSDARRHMPVLADAFQRRNQSISAMIGAELKALGCANAAALARVFQQMVLETAQIENETGAPNPALRRALEDVLANALAASPAGKSAVASRTH